MNSQDFKMTRLTGSSKWIGTANAGHGVDPVSRPKILRFSAFDRAPKPQVRICKVAEYLKTHAIKFIDCRGGRGKLWITDAEKFKSHHQTLVAQGHYFRIIPNGFRSNPGKAVWLLIFEAA